MGLATRGGRIGWVGCVALLAAGCGASSPSSAPAPEAVATSGGGAAGYGGEAEYARAERTTMADEESAGDDDRGFEVEIGSEARGRVLEAPPPPPPPPSPQGPTVATGTTTATVPPATTGSATDIDDTGPLLIYEADLQLAVNDVQQKQREAITTVRGMGGFIARQDDTTVVLRVPARRFDEALALLERLGDVLHRSVQSHDVTEEFRDLDVRLRNALAMRDRLQELLERAGNVQDSIEVERELERITTLIEQMRGRRRFLADRVAFSTITLRLQGLPTETLGVASSQFRLPFPWLDQLGLARLLDLSTAE